MKTLQENSRPLFREKQRDHVGPGLYSEPTFRYLDRSARPQVANVRELLNGWFNRVPAEERETLRKRLRDDFQPAFFELALHELLLRFSQSIEIHPEVPDTTRHPDFLAKPVTGPAVVEANKGQCCYLEAAVVAEATEAEQKEREAHNRIIDSLNEFRDPNFFFGIATMEGTPIATPSRKTLHRLLRECVVGLDPDVVAATLRDGGRLVDLPRAHLHHAGMHVEVHPIPKAEKSRGDEALRSIGMGPVRGGWRRGAEALRSVIKRKASAYGRPDLPLVVAINAIGEFGIEDDDVLEALFGSESVVVRLDDGSTQLTRERNGVWTDSATPTYTRLSAVLVGFPLLPWNLTTARLRLFHNPWATHPYTGPLTQLPQCHVVEGAFQWSDGKSIADILQLPDGWPS